MCGQEALKPGIKEFHGIGMKYTEWIIFTIKENCSCSAFGYGHDWTMTVEFQMYKALFYSMLFPEKVSLRFLGVRFGKSC